MAEKVMVTVDGIRYRKEDAERLGKTSKTEKSAAKAKTPSNKAATPNDK